MWNTSGLVLVSGLALSAWGGQAQETSPDSRKQAVQTLPFEDFEKLHKSLQPHDTGAWSDVPWQVSLMEAREVAILENKPLFLWTLDGHPLGNC